LKRTALLLLIVILLFTSGCAPARPEDTAKIIRDSVLSADTVQLTADILADYGSRAYQFRLRLTSNENGWQIEVLEPETISGITACFSPDSVTLEFDGLILDTGDLSAAGLSPMNSLPTIVGAWLNGHVEEAIRYTDGSSGLISVTYTVSDSTSVCTVFEEETLLPKEARVDVDGSTAITCFFDHAVIE